MRFRHKSDCEFWKYIGGRMLCSPIHDGHSTVRATRREVKLQRKLNRRPQMYGEHQNNGTLRHILATSIAGRYQARAGTVNCSLRL